MRLALFAPVNHPDRPQAQDALRLARALQRMSKLTTYVRIDPSRPGPLPADLRVESQQAFEGAALRGDFDHVLYFLANDAYLCEYVGRRLEAARGNQPGGVVLLRDATLQHYFQTVTLYLGDARNYLEGAAQSHGALGELAGPVVVAGGGHDLMFRELDMLRFFLEGAAAVLVSTSELERRVAGLSGQLVPLVGRVPRGVAVATPSRELRDRALVAAGLAPQPGARAFLVRAGSAPLEQRDAFATALRLVEDERTANVVLHGATPASGTTHQRIGAGTADAADDSAVPAWDAVIDLREPFEGGVLAQVLRWVSAQVPVVVGDFPGFGDLPREMPRRVPIVPFDPAAASGLARRASPSSALDSARAFVAREHSAEAEAAAIVRFLGQHALDLAERTAILGNVREAILAERRRATCVSIREGVFRGMPTDLPGGLGARWAEEIDAELKSWGIDSAPLAGRGE